MRAYYKLSPGIKSLLGTLAGGGGEAVLSNSDEDNRQVLPYNINY